MITRGIRKSGLFELRRKAFYLTLETLPSSFCLIWVWRPVTTSERLGSKYDSLLTLEVCVASVVNVVNMKESTGRPSPWKILGAMSGRPSSRAVKLNNNKLRRLWLAQRSCLSKSARSRALIYSQNKDDSCKAVCTMRGAGAGGNEGHCLSNYSRIESAIAKWKK